MFLTKRIGKNSKDLEKIKALYISAFPENERFSFSMMIKNENGHYETFGFYKDGVFCGFAILLNSLDISHIIYFATLPEMRGKGILSIHLKHTAIKGSVFIEVVAHDLDIFPSFIKAIASRLYIPCICLIHFHELCIENPVDQIIFVLEVIVKTLAVHMAAFTDIGYADFFKRLFLQQFLQCIGKGQFGNIGICHFSLLIIKKRGPPV